MNPSLVADVSGGMQQLSDRVRAASRVLLRTQLTTELYKGRSGSGNLTLETVSREAEGHERAQLRSKNRNEFTLWGG